MYGIIFYGKELTFQEVMNLQVCFNQQLRIFHLLHAIFILKFCKAL